MSLSALLHGIVLLISCCGGSGGSSGGSSRDWTCATGMSAFCDCGSLRVLSPAMCELAERQCRASFCSPGCLVDAWRVVVTVDCSAAPGWAGCARYAAEMRAGGAAALISQFSAYVCANVLGCCTSDSPALHLAIEDGLFGDAYPARRLPMATCAAARGARAATCDACARATSVRIDADETRCIPRGAMASGGGATANGGGVAAPAAYGVQPKSPAERCMYIASVVTAAAERLVPALQDAVCACTGCCEADGGEEADDAAAAAARESGSAGALRERRPRVCLFDLPEEDAWRDADAIGEFD